jgi:hypothetical protein
MSEREGQKAQINFDQPLLTKQAAHSNFRRSSSRCLSLRNSPFDQTKR